jgi:hypothetical protein
MPDSKTQRADTDHLDTIRSLNRTGSTPSERRQRTRARAGTPANGGVDNDYNNGSENPWFWA